MPLSLDKTASKTTTRRLLTANGVRSIRDVTRRACTHCRTRRAVAPVPMSHRRSIRCSASSEVNFLDGVDQPCRERVSLERSEERVCCTCVRASVLGRNASDRVCLVSSAHEFLVVGCDTMIGYIIGSFSYFFMSVFFPCYAQDFARRSGGNVNRAK